jgi:D-arabinose 1-dehydrogenase-like Zn-dependent alcohol dehydrogenase
MREAPEQVVRTLEPKKPAPSTYPARAYAARSATSGLTWSPLRHWDIGKGHKVGVVGLGGLGHMAVKFAHAFGADVVLFTTTPGKTGDAERLGAREVVVSTREREVQKHQGSGLADFKRPRFFRLVRELPTSATGKKQQRVASAWARHDFDRPRPSAA